MVSYVLTGFLFTTKLGLRCYVESRMVGWRPVTGFHARANLLQRWESASHLFDKRSQISILLALLIANAGAELSFAIENLIKNRTASKFP